MTAPDSRDSVERVVAEMQHYANGSTSLCPASVIDKWADRLQALARGPQQAGGEDVPEKVVAWMNEREAWRSPRAPSEPGTHALVLADDYAALQAEVARLTRAQITVGATTLTCSSAVKEMFDLQQTALREAHEGEVSQVEWEDSDRIIVHIEKDEGDVMMWEDVREGVRVRIAGPRLVRDGDSGEG